MSKKKSNPWPGAARRALKAKFSGPVAPDKNGYVSWPDQNLLPGIELRQFEEDLRGGAGDELRMKFCAVHSSAALAVNSFAYFKDNADQLRLLGHGAFAPPVFERQCPTGLGGTPPNLDVWLESADTVIAIESKLLEYFTPKEAKYSDSYKRKSVPYAEPCWWDVLEESKTAAKRNLDVAQLVKHYLGLIRHLRESHTTSITLLYLFWEPTNSDDIEVCVQHREQACELAERVRDSDIQFRWMTYNTLWDEWGQYPRLQSHVTRLRERYAVVLPP